MKLYEQYLLEQDTSQLRPNEQLMLSEWSIDDISSQVLQKLFLSTRDQMKNNLLSKLDDEIHSGKISPENAREYSEKYGEELNRLESQPFNIFLDIQPIVLLFGITSLGMLLGYGVKLLYFRYLSKAANSCKGVHFKKRTICIYNAMIKSHKDVVVQLKKSMSKCNAVKDPNSCKKQFVSKIQKQEKKIKKLESKLHDVTSGNSGWG